MELCGIYKIKCDDCDNIYIGKTNRSFKKRFTEHIRAINNKNIQISQVAEHVIKNKHKITNIDKNMEIIEICNNNKKLTNLEKWYIYIHKKNNILMNRQVDYDEDLLFTLNE